MVEEDEETCTFCGAPVSKNWIGLEVQRPVFDADGRQRDVPDYLTDQIFCSQEHAALWLARPLPEPEPLGGSRFGAWVSGAVMLFLLVLLGIGVLTTVWFGGNWLIDAIAAAVSG